MLPVSASPVSCWLCCVVGARQEARMQIPEVWLNVLVCSRAHAAAGMLTVCFFGWQGGGPPRASTHLLLITWDSNC